jgi:hypothetical protein
LIWKEKSSVWRADCIAAKRPQSVPEITQAR